MRVLCNTLVLFTCMVFLSCHTSEDFSGVIAKVRDRYVPDSRVAICDVNAYILGDYVILKGETTEKEVSLDLLKYFKEKEINVIDSIRLLAKGLEHPWGIVTISAANLRDNPKFSAQLVSQLIMGSPVKILKKKSDWVLVQGPDKYIGWMTASSLQEMNIKEYTYWGQSERVMVLNDTWLVDNTGSHISDLVKGSIVQKNSSDVRRYTLPDHRIGYIKNGNVKRLEDCVSEDGLNADSLCATAFKFMGLPYLWGGTSSKAVDCSGFMKNIYFLNGYILARDASQQILHGLRLPLVVDSLRKGDLLFFGRKDPLKVTHVAMYIGNFHYIHASGRVKVNSLYPEDKDFSAARLYSWVGAVRYINQPVQNGLQPIVSHDWYFSN